MGYCVSWDVRLSVPKANIKGCLEAINELMKPENVEKNGRGGSWQGGQKTGVWYSWVNNPPNNRYSTIQEAFDGWGFACEIGKNSGGLEVKYCENEKLGQEELFLEAIAPYVDKNSEVVVRGEDGAVWRWVFKNGHLVQQEGRLTFEE